MTGCIINKTGEGRLRLQITASEDQGHKNNSTGHHKACRLHWKKKSTIKCMLKGEGKEEAGSFQGDKYNSSGVEEK